MWDLAEGNHITAEACDVDAIKKLVMDNVIASLEEYKNEIAREWERQTEIKEKYGIRSLEHLIVRLDGDLIAPRGRMCELSGDSFPVCAPFNLVNTWDEQIVTSLWPELFERF